MSTTGRRLELLALIQACPGITAAKLAAKLDVDERTTRRDIDHLRGLGYGITANSGRYGGYSMTAGSVGGLLALDPAEIAAVAIGLRALAADPTLAQSAATAMAKVHAAVPRRARSRLEAMSDVDVPPATRPDRSDPAILLAVAQACRGGEAIRIRQVPRADGSAPTAERLQPLRVLLLAGHWYLLASPGPDQGWRTYRIDRIDRAQPLGHSIPAPDPPPDPVRCATDSIGVEYGRHRVEVRVHSSADTVRERVPATTALVIAEREDTCRLVLGTDDLDWAARYLIALNFDIDVLTPDALTGHLAALGHWLVECYDEKWF
ncbi:MAG: WYL domain-containing protein [Dermatophilaceae bacterium]